MRPPAERNIQSNQLTISHEGGLAKAASKLKHVFVSLSLSHMPLMAYLSITDSRTIPLGL